MCIIPKLEATKNFRAQRFRSPIRSGMSLSPTICLTITRWTGSYTLGITGELKYIQLCPQQRISNKLHIFRSIGEGFGADFTSHLIFFLGFCILSFLLHVVISMIWCIYVWVKWTWKRLLISASSIIYTPAPSTVPLSYCVLSGVIYEGTISNCIPYD